MDAAPANSPRIDRYLAESERGSFTSVEIAVPPEAVWDAMGQTTLSECRLTGMLVTLRGLPARLTRRGAFSSNSGDRGDAGASLVINRKGGRFLALDEVPGEELVLGLVGQFWKPSGGTDVTLADAAAFVAFNEPGYVKTAVNFRVEATSDGARLTTETRSVTTSASARRKFAAYWLVVGLGSKLIRRDMLGAVRRRAEASTR